MEHHVLHQVAVVVLVKQVTIWDDCQTSRDIAGEQSEGGDGVNSIHGMDTTAFSHFLWI